MSDGTVIGFIVGFGFGVMCGVALSAFLLVRATLFLARLGKALQEKRRQGGSEKHRPA